jgi:hypothetical protein
MAQILWGGRQNRQRRCRRNSGSAGLTLSSGSAGRAQLRSESPSPLSPLPVVESGGTTACGTRRSDRGGSSGGGLPSGQFRWAQSTRGGFRCAQRPAWLTQCKCICVMQRSGPRCAAPESGRADRADRSDGSMGGRGTARLAPYGACPGRRDEVPPASGRDHARACVVRTGRTSSSVGREPDGAVRTGQPPWIGSRHGKPCW